MPSRRTRRWRRRIRSPRSTGRPETPPPRPARRGPTRSPTDWSLDPSLHYNQSNRVRPPTQTRTATRDPPTRADPAPPFLAPRRAEAGKRILADEEGVTVRNPSGESTVLVAFVIGISVFCLLIGPCRRV